MNDHELDRLLRRAQPASAALVPAVAPVLGEAGRELLEEIMSAPERIAAGDQTVAAEIIPMPVRHGAPRYARWSLGVAAAVAVVLAVVLPMQVFGAHPGSAPPAAPSGGVTPTRTAAGLPQTPLTGEGIPHFVLDDPSWSLSAVRSESQGGSELWKVPGTSRALQIGWGQLAGSWPRAGQSRRVTVFGIGGLIVALIIWAMVE